MNGEPNDWDRKNERPLTGKGGYNIPGDDAEDDAKPRRGAGRQGRKGKGNAWEDRDERPIGGKGTYDISDEEEARAWNNPRDERPLTGKGGYIIPDDMKGEAFQGQEGADKAKPKRQIAKKTKYDPRKAIEDAKKREELEG